MSKRCLFFAEKSAFKIRTALNKETLENMKNYIEKIQYFLDSIYGIPK